MEAIRNIKHIIFKEKVITCPVGYDEMREHGRVYPYNKLIFTTTCVKDGKYSLHYWIDWVHKGKLNIRRQGEDGNLSFYGGYFHIFYEDKDAEKQGRFEIVHERVFDISNRFDFVERYTPADTGIVGCLAVYSWKSINANEALCDYRTVPGGQGVYPEENIGFVKRVNGKWGTLKPIILAKDYGYISLGVDGDLHRVDGKWVLEVVGKLPNGKWVTGLMECSTITGRWKLLNRALVNEKGEYVFATFFKDVALAGLNAGKQELYLADLITKDGSPKPPVNGGNMIPKNLNYHEGLLIWDCDDNPDEFHIIAEGTSPSGWIKTLPGTIRQYQIPSNFILNKQDSQRFRVVSIKNSNPYRSEWKTVVFSIVPKPDPKPTDNTEVISRMQDRINKMAAELSSLDDDLKLIKPQ